MVKKTNGVNRIRSGIRYRGENSKWLGSGPDLSKVGRSNEEGIRRVELFSGGLLHKNKEGYKKKKKKERPRRVLV